MSLTFSEIDTQLLLHLILLHGVLRIPSCPMASFFMLSFFIESFAIPSLLMASLLIESLLILSCAWAIGLTASPVAATAAKIKDHLTFIIVSSSKVLTAHPVRCEYVFPIMSVTRRRQLYCAERAIYPRPTCNKCQGAHEHEYPMRGASHVNAFRHHPRPRRKPFSRDRPSI